jgi:uncharacterized protein YdeI (YjbR/CyaY-like superfamily)
MPKKHTFTAIIQNAGGGGAFVEIPADLKQALSRDDAAKSAFDRLPASHRKEYVTWITEAKRDETRQARVAKTIEMLKRGNKPR